ncbi:MAG: PTS transporter subunit EIIB [Desulfuromonadales bacterium]|nr:PTS transporter subunit EIIB [Desulfuromonadales bacterium]
MRSYRLENLSSFSHCMTRFHTV